MRTIDFSQVLFDSLQFCGNDRHNISDETFSQFRDFCSFRLREAWESFQWSDVCKLSKLTTQVDANEVTYVTLPADCGEVLGIFSRNPQATTKAVEVQFQLHNNSGTARAVLSNVLDEVWCFYRIKCPTLSGEAYAETTPYYKDALAYFDAGAGTGTFIPVLGKPCRGNFYKCLDNGPITGESPAASPTKWEIVEIPYIFASYMSWGAAANFFASEMMLQEAATIESKAKEVLEQEYDKVLRQQSQFGRMNMVKTY
jgi:hypothetical protein